MTPVWRKELHRRSCCTVSRLELLEVHKTGIQGLPGQSNEMAECNRTVDLSGLETSLCRAAAQNTNRILLNSDLALLTTV